MDETQKALLRQIEKRTKEVEDLRLIYSVALNTGLSPSRRERCKARLQEATVALGDAEHLRRIYMIDKGFARA